MDIQKYDYQGNANTGFYATFTNEQAIVPPEFNSSNVFNCEKVVETYIARTRLVGLFTAGNSNCILVPATVTDREKDKLDEKDIDYEIIDTHDTALGNLILANDKGAIISEKIEHKEEKIEEALEVPVKVGKVANISNPGVCGLTNGYGAVLHRETSEEEAEIVKDVLDLEKVDIGTTNGGSPFVGAGALANDKGILVSENTTGPEIGRIDRTLVDHE